MKLLVLTVFVAALVSSAVACDSSSSADAEPGAGEGRCCPISAEISGTMKMGGSGECAAWSDFWCTTNWRQEPDDAGCPTWRFDKTSPREGEDSTCINRSPPDAGGDAPSDAGTD
jgi:hypothetical protein